MLINLRNALMAGKRTPTAKDYVQNGLIAMWDGIENVGWGVHDASATTWVNLANPGSDIALTSGNSTWNENSLVASERVWNTDFNSVKLGDDTNIPQSWATVEIVVQYDSGALIARADAAYNSIMLSGFGDKRGLQFAYESTANAGIRHSSLPQGMFYACNTKGSDNVATGAYLNGIRNTLAIQRSNFTFRNRFGCGYATSAANAVPFMGKIAAMRFYSRELTASEIAANYAIDKARFGLP